MRTRISLFAALVAFGIPVVAAAQTGGAAASAPSTSAGPAASSMPAVTATAAPGAVAPASGAAAPGAGAAAPAPGAGTASLVSSTVIGSVVDRATGLALPGVRVTIVGTAYSALTDASGAFNLAVPAGVYTFQAQLRNYQTAQTDAVTLKANTLSTVTLSLNRAEAQGSSYNQIAHTTTRGNDALQPASVIQHTVSTSDALAEGVIRIDRAIEDLPNITISSGLSTPGIEDTVSLRGLIGETQQLIDGHPTEAALSSIGLFPFQSVSVTYGSGKGTLFPINAIGGVINLVTLQPTRTPSATFLQGFGTFDHLTSELASTGTYGRLGYAVSFGTEGEDAPYARTTRYEPLTGWDPTATNTVRDRSFIYINSPWAVRSDLIKLKYQASPAFSITASTIANGEPHLNDGDKSVDLHTYARELADGNRNLANKGATDTCGAGTFTATNFAGVANGTGPDGSPDGGFPCQTPQQYASLRAGYTTGEYGSITELSNDQDIKFEMSSSHNYGLVDVYSSFFRRRQTYANSAYTNVLGDLNDLHTKHTDDSFAGATLEDDQLFPNDDFGAGFYTNNYRQNEVDTQVDPVKAGSMSESIFTYGNDIRTYFLKEVHHVPGTPLTVYAYDYIKDSEEPHAFFNDPRLAILYRRGNNSVRVAAGQASSLPYAPEGQPYVATPLAQFTNGVNCNGNNSVGTAPSGYTKPERATDEEASFSRRWFGDSFTQFEVYNQNFASKVEYGYNAPLGYTGTAFLPVAELNAYLAAVASKCGGVTGPNLLTLQGNYNLGRVLARGIDITGRQRAGRAVFFDYSYGTQSVQYRSLPNALVEGDKRVFIGGQTFDTDSGQGIPLHSSSVAVDASAQPGLEGRLTGYYTSAGNEKGLPAYIRTDLSLSKSFGRSGVFSAYVYNLLNYAAYYDAIDGFGIPLPLNKYATASDYQQFYGAGAQNRYGLGPRTVEFTYQVRF